MDGLTARATVLGGDSFGRKMRAIIARTRLAHTASGCEGPRGEACRSASWVADGVRSALCWVTVLVAVAAAGCDPGWTLTARNDDQRPYLVRVTELNNPTIYRIDPGQIGHLEAGTPGSRIPTAGPGGRRVRSSMSCSSRETAVRSSS